VETDQAVAEEQPVNAWCGGKEDPGAWVHVWIVPAFIVVDRFGFDRQRPSPIFGVGVLSEPLFNPLESRVAVEDIDLRDHPSSDELVDLRGDLSKVSQQCTADHQDQTTAKDLVVLEQIGKVLPKVLYHPIDCFPIDFAETSAAIGHAC